MNNSIFVVLYLLYVHIYMGNVSNVGGNVMYPLYLKVAMVKGYLLHFPLNCFNKNDRYITNEVLQSILKYVLLVFTTIESKNRLV